MSFALSFKQILLPKDVDLDIIGFMFAGGIDPKQANISFIAGSASGKMLRDPEVMCVEVGSLGAEKDAKLNNFEHHRYAEETENGEPAKPRQSRLSVAAQMFERTARVIRYIDAVDCGEFERLHRVGFPTLVQLVSGMQLAVKEPALQIKHGQEILQAVVLSGIDPFTQSLEPILGKIPGARAWAEEKRRHEALFAEAMQKMTRHTTKKGVEVGAIESELIGTVGAAYGLGVDIVVAQSPCVKELGSIRKSTIASRKGKSILLHELAARLTAMEIEKAGVGGWGGPDHGTIIASSKTHSTALTIGELVKVVVEML